MKNRIRTTCAFAAAALISLALPGMAFAVDGQNAITQARAMAGGVTPGDAPGFPITITQPGSYVLSGNLTVPNANTDAIVINASHVTLDLNGFAILGLTDCSGGLHPCLGDGIGNGIVTPSLQFNITVRNGTIQGMGCTGILLVGDSDLVEYVHARSNGCGGIRVLQSVDQGSGIVQFNLAERNGGSGIFLASGVARNNVANVNLIGGIELVFGSASLNVVTRNGFGLFLSSEASYFGNVLIDNTFNVNGGTNLGQNLCNTTVCPGAVF